MHLRRACRWARSIPSLVRREILGRAPVLTLLLCSGPVWSASPRCTDFLSLDPHTVDWDTCRPAPVGPEEKNRVLQSLPAEGEVRQLTERERQKLKDLTAVLRLHGRESIYEIKVISVPQAWTGLYGRAVLLISQPALQLLRSEELQALVAHEIGHEYVWSLYEAAQRRQQTVSLRELELACDAIAVFTLERLEISPHHLVRALEKVFRFNRERWGQAANESRYPSLETRRNLIRNLSQGTGERPRWSRQNLTGRSRPTQVDPLGAFPPCFSFLEP